MEITVLQWNVLFAEKGDNILSLITEIGADVVCLQELTQNSAVNPNRNLPAEIAALGYQSFYKATDIQPDLTIGNGIFSKFPQSNCRTTYVSRSDPDNTDYPQYNRAYIEAVLDIEGDQLTVGTAHLSYTPNFKFFPGKVVESQRFVELIRTKESRYLLTGDFNATPDSSLISDLDKLLVSSGPDYNEATWTTKPFDMHGFAADTLDWRLDYIFATSDIDVLSSEVVSTDYSDHLPVLVKVLV